MIVHSSAVGIVKSAYSPAGISLPPSVTGLLNLIRNQNIKTGNNFAEYRNPKLNVEFRISKIKLAYDERNASRRLSEAGVCGPAVGVVPGSRARPWFAFGRENRADASAFAWMAGKCVS